MWLNIIIGATFFAIGAAVHIGKMYFLISGYNTMRKEKKANVDIRGLARLVGLFSYINGVIFILVGILQAAGIKIGMMFPFVFLMVSSLVMVVLSQRYDYNLFDEYGRLRRGAKTKLLIPAGIILVTLVFVAVMMFYSAQSTKVELQEEGLKIYGMYGDVYSWETIHDVKCLEALPLIEARTNGSALGSKLKGNFRAKEVGNVKLFVDEDIPPFIYFETGKNRIIFNLPDADETDSVYEKILEKTGDH
jgi:hypothetical protein